MDILFVKGVPRDTLGFTHQLVPLLTLYRIALRPS